MSRKIAEICPANSNSFYSFYTTDHVGHQDCKIKRHRYALIKLHFQLMARKTVVKMFKMKDVLSSLVYPQTVTVHWAVLACCTALQLFPLQL